MESNEKKFLYEECPKPEPINQNNSNQNLIVSNIDSSSSGVINSASMSDNSNSMKMMNESVGMEMDKLKEKKNPKPIEILINKKENYIQFFIRAIGNNLICYEANINSIIGKYIEDYVKRECLNDEIKNKFFKGEKPIDNLDKTIKELEIDNLDVISTK